MRAGITVARAPDDDHGKIAIARLGRTVGVSRKARGTRPRTQKGLAWGAHLAAALALSAPAATVAQWTFDEPTDFRPGPLLRDAGPGRHDLILGPGGRLVPGRSGHALQPVAAGSTGGTETDYTALTAPARGVFANVTDSKLNLGPGDWTLEGWFRLASESDDEGTLLEIGTGPRGANELVTRVSVRPREHALVVSGLSPVAPGSPAMAGRRIEFANPEGPPGGVATALALTLAADRPLPREAWFHAAIVHTVDGLFRLFLDGRPSAVARADLMALPRSADGYLVLGCDGRAGRPFPGWIDQLSVSDHALAPAELAALAASPAPASR